MSAKRVHDACEVYDGVPSLHDAKAAQVIGRVYFAMSGLGFVYRPADKPPLEDICDTVKALGEPIRLVVLKEGGTLQLNCSVCTERGVTLRLKFE